jgi:hypothetical protein
MHAKAIRGRRDIYDFTILLRRLGHPQLDFISGLFRAAVIPLDIGNHFLYIYVA